MFEDWTTYHLSDFLLFSPQTYLQLFEAQNRAVWPLGHALILTGVAVLVIAFRRRKRSSLWTHLASLVMVTALTSVAAGFLWTRFQPVNFVARYYAFGFVIEAVVIFYLGVIKDAPFSGSPKGLRRAIGLGLMAWAIALKPIVDLLIGRPPEGVEFFGLAPDPTAVATIGFLVATAEKSSGPVVMLILIPPALWCMVSGLTLWGLQLPGSAPLFAVASSTALYSLFVAMKPPPAPVTPDP